MRFINSKMKDEEKEVVLHCLTSKECPYQFFFTTPESLCTMQMKSVINKMKENNNLARLIVDEAHCVDIWGSYFHPSYSELHVFKEYGIQIVAFTGTATERTVKTIIERLQLGSPKVMKMPLDRPNLIYQVYDKYESKSMEKIVELVDKDFHGKCGIIYCFATRDTIDMAYFLKQKGIKAVYYHGQLDLYEQERNASAWYNGRADVMCATNAFGMGIDKNNVHFVIHHSIPKSMEDYFQEAGRAGRDGNTAHCILFFRFSDRVKILKHISEIEDTSHKENAKKQLDEVTKYCIVSKCRKEFMLKYFNDDASTEPCKACDLCLHGSVTTEPKDMTTSAVQIIHCVNEMIQLQPKVSLKLITLVYRGHKTKEVVSKGLHATQHFGRGKVTFKNDKDATRLIYHMIARGFLVENLRSTLDRSPLPFITLGKDFEFLLDGTFTFMV